MIIHSDRPDNTINGQAYRAALAHWPTAGSLKQDSRDLAEPIAADSRLSRINLAAYETASVSMQSHPADLARMTSDSKGEP